MSDMLHRGHSCTSSFCLKVVRIVLSCPRHRVTSSTCRASLHRRMYMTTSRPLQMPREAVTMVEAFGGFDLCEYFQSGNRENSNIQVTEQKRARRKRNNGIAVGLRCIPSRQRNSVPDSNSH